MISQTERSKSTAQKIDVTEAMRIAEWSANNLIDIAPEIAHVLKLKTFSKLRPDLAHAFDPVIEAIAESTPLPSRTYTPTKIGALLGEQLQVGKISAIAVNKKLVELGYQKSVTRTNSKKEMVHHFYQPTDQGREFGQIELSAFKAKNGGGATQPQLRWYEGIVNILAEELSKQAANN